VPAGYIFEVITDRMQPTSLTDKTLHGALIATIPVKDDIERSKLMLKALRILAANVAS
jgi:hypothetical protein